MHSTYPSVYVNHTASLSRNICFEFSVKCLYTAVRKGGRPEIYSSIAGQFMEAWRTSGTSYEVMKALRSEGVNYTVRINIMTSMKAHSCCQLLGKA
jgi:hypothetical protein